MFQNSSGVAITSSMLIRTQKKYSDTMQNCPYLVVGKHAAEGIDSTRVSKLTQLGINCCLDVCSFFGLDSNKLKQPICVFNEFRSCARLQHHAHSKPASTRKSCKQSSMIQIHRQSMAFCGKSWECEVPVCVSSPCMLLPGHHSMEL